MSDNDEYERGMAEAKARFRAAMAPFDGIRWLLLPIGVAAVLLALGLM
jgi:hypothetical protein